MVSAFGCYSLFVYEWEDLNTIGVLLQFFSNVKSLFHLLNCLQRCFAGVRGATITAVGVPFEAVSQLG